jgi:nicotinamide phosphoribosyltransferase
VPCLVIYNTHPEFFWLTNYLETIISSCMWKPITSATIAHHYKILLTKHAEQTGSDKGFIPFQAHDFSFRGMSGPEDAALSGAAHLTSFVGTDSVPAIDLLEDYYGANSDKELVGCSVPATEHSVMCMGTKDDEIGTFKRLVTELYPKGIVSIVSDTWDFWKVITEYAVALKYVILHRDGKVVFRPDSGDPVKIICGDESYGYNSPSEEAWQIHKKGTPVYKGAVECLWDIFGGTVNEAGYKVLDPHVGVIYGDSITLERAHLILKGLRNKGFAASNVVFGVGSFTYQHVTRDSFGFAVKSTAGRVGGQYREIFKDPVTDNGIKKSAKGFIKVKTVDGKLQVFDQQPEMVSADCEMRDVFKDGKLLIDDKLSEIRQRL